MSYYSHLGRPHLRQRKIVFTVTENDINKGSRLSSFTSTWGTLDSTV